MQNEEKCKKEWIEKFCRTNGLAHLFNSLMNLPTTSLYNPLTRRCFSLLIKIIYTIQVSGFALKKWVRDYADNKNTVVDRILIVLNSFAKYSIAEDVKSLNKAPQVQDEKELKLEGKAFEYGFSLLRNEESNYFECIMKFPEFKNFLINGLILSGNPFIKIALKKEMLRIFNLYKDKEPSESHAHVILIPYMIQTMVKQTLNSNSNCKSFYELLCDMIKDLPNNSKLPIDFLEEMKTIANYIKEHKIRENKASNTDYLIIGLMNLLSRIIERFPASRDYLCNDMLNEVLHKCLFEFPDSENRIQLASSIPPKCKSQASRQAALNLLSILCRDSCEAILKAVEYLMPIHKNASWRTKRRADWAIVPEADEKSTTGYVGLKNLGAICYMNSLLQQLYMIPSFRNDILSAVDPEQTTVSEDNLLLQTQYLFSALNKSVKQHYNPKAFCNAVKDWDNNPINVLEQMDIDEFFNLFLDRLETVLKRTQQKNTIKKHFGGVFANQIIGKDCPHTSTRKEPFLALNLQVKNKRTLQQCLESFVNGEMLQGSNAYFCEKCDKKITALKRTCIKKLPRHLICVLKRFDLNYDTMQKFKINDYCEFPQRINMERYTEEGLAKLDREKELEKARKEGRDESSIKSKPIKEYPKEYYEYKLTGVVIHIGTSDMGHYYSFILDREHENIPEKDRWYEFNDTQVEKYDLERMKDDAFGNEGKIGGERFFIRMRNAYLLFYERISPYEPPVEDDEEIPEKPMETTITPKLDISKELHKEIQEENIKYWYSKYIFQDYYFRFVITLGNHWNSKEIVTEVYPTKNQDHHLLGLNCEERKEPMILSEELQKTSTSIAKYVLTVFLTTFVRLRTKLPILPSFVDLCKAYLNKHPEVSQWLILQFTNSKIIHEFLLECTDRLTSRFVVGLLYCAMLNVYNLEKEAIAKGDIDNSLLLNFGNGLLSQLSMCQKSGICSDFFFQALSRLVFLGPEIRHVLLKQNTLKALLNLICSDVKSVRASKLTTEESIIFKWKENDMVEFGLPITLNTKISYFFKDYHTIRGHESELCNVFLIEAISLLLRSTGFNEKVKTSPFMLKDCLVGVSEDIKSILTDPKQISELVVDCNNSIAVMSLIQGLVHVSWENTEVRTAVCKGATYRISLINAGNVNFYVYLLKTILKQEDSLQKMSIDIVMIECIKEMKRQQQHMLPLLKLLLALIEELPAVEKWFRENKEKWEWITTLLRDNRLVKSKRETIISLNRNVNEEQRMLEANVNHYAECFEKLEKGEELGKDDCVRDIYTMYYKKFVKQEKIDYINMKAKRWDRWTVVEVLDEMISLELDRIKNFTDWVEIEKITIAPLGTYTRDGEGREEMADLENKEEVDSDNKEESNELTAKDNSDESMNRE